MKNNLEQTLVIFKPDALRRKLVGEIMNRFERVGLELTALKMIRFTEELCRDHYQHLVEKSFFPELVRYMTSGPSIVGVLSGYRAVAVVRHLVGSTDPLEAAPGTIRADYALSNQENVVHASATIPEAQVEIARFFGSEFPTDL